MVNDILILHTGHFKMTTKIDIYVCIFGICLIFITTDNCSKGGVFYLIPLFKIPIPAIPTYK